MSQIGRLVDSYRLPIIAAINTTIVAVAYYLAFALRFDFVVDAEYTAVYRHTLPWLLLAKLPVFAYYRLYEGWWRYVTLRDLESIVKANVIGTATFVMLVVFTAGMNRYPRSAFLIEMILAIVAMSGIRAIVRIIRERVNDQHVRRIQKLVFVVGAGEAGIQLIREFRGNPRMSIAVVGFIDDDAAKIGMRIAGVTVLGSVADIPRIVASHPVDEILVAMPSARPRDLRRVVQVCNEAKLPCRVLPSIGEIAAGRVMYTQIREFKVEDLLARDPVRLEVSRLNAFLQPRVALVTGAAGSIGSELCRQIASFGGRRVVLLERDENGLFSVGRQLQDRFPDVEFHSVLGDITMLDQLRRLFETHRPQLVLHAAAYKHVPVAELNPLEAARNNISGTLNLVQCAKEAAIDEFVMISTDKAVRPTSVMGATKRVAEMIVQAQHDAVCKFVSVRFGNVLGSTGSVVPIFREQIARHEPITVTHPEMRRFFMTIPEATQLILQAATMGRGGEIFVLEMGEPVRIVDLARNMIQLSGYEPDEDIPIVFTGLRPGEKLYEELLNSGEEIEATFFDRIKILKCATPATEKLERFLSSYRKCLAEGDPAGMIAALQVLLPDYTPSEHVSGRQRQKSADMIGNVRGVIDIAEGLAGA